MFVLVDVYGSTKYVYVLLCLRKDVLLCSRMCVCVSVCTRVHTCVRLDVCLCMCLYVTECGHETAVMRVHLCFRVSLCLSVFAHRSACVAVQYAHTRILVREFVFACICVCVDFFARFFVRVLLACRALRSYISMSMFSDVCTNTITHARILSVYLYGEI